VALLAPESSVDEIVETTEEFMDRLDQLLLALHRRWRRPKAGYLPDPGYHALRTLAVAFPICVTRGIDRQHTDTQMSLLTALKSDERTCLVYCRKHSPNSSFFSFYDMNFKTTCERYGARQRLNDSIYYYTKQKVLLPKLLSV
jgi:hypothetical protein